MRQYETIEFCYTAPAPEGSEAAVNLQAEFIHERERTVVKGFYAGNQTYIVRFLPSKAGEYQYRVFGIVNASGSFFAEPAAGSHGMVQAEGRYFRYQDGMSLCIIRLRRMPPDSGTCIIPASLTGIFWKNSFADWRIWGFRRI